MSLAVTSHLRLHRNPKQPGVIFKPPSLLVRAAQSKDLAALVDVISSSFYPHTGLMRWFLPVLRMGVYEDLRYRLRSSLASDYVCLVAIMLPVAEQPASREVLAGTVEMTLRLTSPFQFRSLPYPYLSNLAVCSEYRRQGVAQRLLHTCETIAIAQGFQDLYLHVLEDNHPARQLYSKAGYQTTQTGSFWHCWLFKQPRKLLLHKRLLQSSEKNLNNAPSS